MFEHPVYRGAADLQAARDLGGVAAVEQCQNLRHGLLAHGGGPFGQVAGLALELGPHGGLGAGDLVRRLATRYIKGHAKLEWIKPSGKRNEALDCAVYAYAAACYLGIQTLREHGWARREDRYCPRSPDLFSQTAQNTEKTADSQRTAVTDSYKKRSETQPDATPTPKAARPFSRDW